MAALNFISAPHSSLASPNISSSSFRATTQVALLISILWCLPIFAGHLLLFSTDDTEQCCQGEGVLAAPSSNKSKNWIAAAPIAFGKRRRLRVVIYARYSSEEQDESSIPDQVAYCKKWMERMGIGDAEIEEISDPEKSGELRNRPGIDVIWAGIKKPNWDLLIAEDASRLFRKESACLELVEEAVDNGMRCIAINDAVDTSEDGWQDRLRDAARHHEKANHYIRMRIKRRQTALWALGAAITRIRPGYVRTPTRAATEKDPAEGPFFDAIDPQWQTVIDEAYDRIGNGAAPWEVGLWLRSQGLPTFTKSTPMAVLQKKTIALVRQTIYRGSELFRKTVVKKKLRTGKVQTIFNDENGIWRREMPHLRMVDDAKWYRANRAVDERRSRENVARGGDHPLFGIPRNSRGPLSKLLLCAACKRKFHKNRRNEGGYSCSAAMNNECWNKATCLTSVAQQNIGRAISEQLLYFAGLTDTLVEYVHAAYVTETALSERRNELRREQQRLLKQQSRLMAAIKTSDDSPEILVTELKVIQQNLAEIEAFSAELESGTTEQKPEVTRERILAAIRDASGRLLSMDREIQSILERLIPDKILLVPFQLFGTNKVVLRAEFELHLVNIVPQDLLSALNGGPVQSAQWLAPIPMLVDLFPHAEVPANALRAISLYQDHHHTLDELASELRMSRRQAHRAKDLGKAMRESGLTDPYVRLLAPPASASRWRLHDKFKAAPPKESDAA